MRADSRVCVLGDAKYKSNIGHATASDFTTLDVRASGVESGAE